ncbi:MAG: transposase [Nostoc sp. EfeVER01]|uniref:transposase n=1 Tax=unclassified Nostoc TaxID=2593658 RepID=UPI002AD3F001|nr:MULTISPECIES: transposase [unclassified Nostoc]MDZ7990685.1 transposase [Nostoc sp. EspVER01]
MREVVNAIFYILRAGCSWRMMPHDLPAWQTVYSYFRRWERKGVWHKGLEIIKLCDRTCSLLKLSYLLIFPRLPSLMPLCCHIPPIAVIE